MNETWYVVKANGSGNPDVVIATTTRKEFAHDITLALMLRENTRKSSYAFTDRIPDGKSFVFDKLMVE